MFKFKANGVFNFTKGSLSKQINSTIQSKVLRYSSQTGEPLIYKQNKISSQLKGPSKTIGISFLLSAGCLALGLGGWIITHFYVETYLHSTDSRLSNEVRSYLRGAYLREEISVDPNMVEMYLLKAIEKIKLDKELSQNDLEYLNIHFRLANNYIIRNMKDKALDNLIFIWYQIYSNLDVNEKQKLDLLFNTGYQLSNLYIRLNQYDLADKYINKGLDILNSENINNKEKTKIDYFVNKANVLALKQQYDDSLNLYNNILKQINSIPLIDSKHPWGCIQSIVLGYKAKVLEAKNQTEEAISVAWEAYKASEPYHSISIAGELSGATALKLLANLYEDKKEWQTARACLAKALPLAQSALDKELALNIGKKMVHVQDMIDLSVAE